jgi:hypothetical protein
MKRQRADVLALEAAHETRELREELEAWAVLEEDEGKKESEDYAFLLPLPASSALQKERIHQIATVVKIDAADFNTVTGNDKAWSHTVDVTLAPGVAPVTFSATNTVPNHGCVTFSYLLRQGEAVLWQLINTANGEFPERTSAKYEDPLRDLKAKVLGALEKPSAEGEELSDFQFMTFLMLATRAARSSGHGEAHITHFAYYFHEGNHNYREL